LTPFFLFEFVPASRRVMGSCALKPASRLRFYANHHRFCRSNEKFRKFHGNERLSILHADVVNGADVGMVQGGSGLRLALKSG